MRRQGIFSFRRTARSREDSFIASTVGIVAMINSFASLSRKRSRTSMTLSCARHGLDDNWRARRLREKPCRRCDVIKARAREIQSHWRSARKLALRRSSFATASSCCSDAPNRPRRAEDAPLSFCRSRMILSSDASTKSGTVSRRSVWPVGAVSKIMRLKRAYSSPRTNSTTCKTFFVLLKPKRPAHEF